MHEPALENEGGGWMEGFAGDELTEHGRTPEQRLAEAEMTAVVDAGLAQLSAVERAVLVLYHQEERSYEAIAAALEMPVNSVRTHLHRGRRRLGALVKQQMQSQGRSATVPARGAA